MDKHRYCLRVSDEETDADNPPYYLMKKLKGEAAHNLAYVEGPDRVDIQTYSSPLRAITAALNESWSSHDTVLVEAVIGRHACWYDDVGVVIFDGKPVVRSPLVDCSEPECAD